MEFEFIELSDLEKSISHVGVIELDPIELDESEPQIEDVIEPKIDDTVEPKIDESNESNEPKIDDVVEPKIDDVVEAIDHLVFDEPEEIVAHYYVKEVAIDSIEQVFFEEPEEPKDPYVKEEIAVIDSIEQIFEEEEDTDERVANNDDHWKKKMRVVIDSIILQTRFIVLNFVLPLTIFSLLCLL